MKKIILSAVVCFGIGLTSVQLVSCKDKPKETDNSTTVSTEEPMAPAPVEVATDEALDNGVRDAVKDYPGVTATVVNGEITLNGTISRDDLGRLMPTLHSLNPKKVNNNLTVQ